MSSEAPRTETGHWPAGVSGNPGGYSKEKRAAVARVADLAREHTPTAIQTLATIMNDEKATRSTRIAAANALLDRAWGKPPQSVGVGLSFDDPEDGNAERSPLEVARTIAFLLARGAHEQELKQRERATAADAEIVGAPHGDG